MVSPVPLPGCRATHSLPGDAPSCEAAVDPPGDSDALAPPATRACDAPMGPPEAPIPHRVERGETLGEIAVRHRMRWRELAAYNHLADPNRLRVGTTLRIPLDSDGGVRPHLLKVTPHDTLGELAAAHDQPLRRVASANRHRIRDPHRIRVGQPVWMPGPRVPAGEPCRRPAPLDAATAPDDLPAAPPDDESIARELALRRDSAAKAWELAAERVEAVLEGRNIPINALREPGADAMRHLEETTRGLTHAQAASVVRQVLPALEAFDDHFQSRVDAQPFGPRGFDSLVEVVDRIADTEDGHLAIDRIARRGFWDMGAMTSAIARGHGAHYALALAARPNVDAERVLDAAFTGLERLHAMTNAHTLEFAGHMEELGWLVSNLGSIMTPAQLDVAIDHYGSGKGAIWLAEGQRLQRQIADDGAKLHLQANTLATLAPQLVGKNQRALDTVAAILVDPLSLAAMTTALRLRPEIAVARHWSSLLDFFSEAQYVSTAKMTDQMRKLAGEFATAYIKRDLMKQMSQFDPGDPRAVQRTTEIFESLRNSRFARYLGMSEKQLDRTLARLRAIVPAAGEAPDVALERVRELDAELKGFKGLDKSTEVGRAVRLFGIALASVGFVASVDRMLENPSEKNVFKATVDAAGMGQKGIEWLGVDAKTRIGRLGGSPVGKFLGGMTALYDVWNATEAFGKRRYEESAYYAMGAGGGLLAAYGSGVMCPAGMLLVAASVYLLGLDKAQQRAERHEPANDGGASMRFLLHAGVSLPAATMLADQSDDGHSVVPLLARYARERGLRLFDPADQLAFSAWISAIPLHLLRPLQASLHETIDELGGQVDLFPPTAPDDAAAVWPLMNNVWGPRVNPIELHSVVQLDALLAGLGVPALAPVSPDDL